MEHRQTSASSSTSSRVSPQFIKSCCASFALFAVSAFILYFLLFGFVYLQASLFPTAKDENAPLDQFSEVRAKNYYPSLEALGETRVVGTPYNNNTVAWLQRQLEQIVQEAKQRAAKTQSKSLPLVDFDFQPFHVPGISAPMYNVLVRILPILQNAENYELALKHASETNYTTSFMLSTHYDSVSISPGGSDDGVGCVVLLEVFRNLLNRKLDAAIGSAEVPAVPIIFMFNNMEEGGLEGANAFVREHRWASSVKRFLNVDSTGGPGKAIMFRLWPSSLAKELVYLPHPHANVIGEELIAFLPSDTDFTEYTHGKLPGFDFAFYQYGYSYHTKLDTPEVLTTGAIQALGENLVALTDRLAYGKTWIETELDYHTLYVYYDFLGLFYVYYPQILAMIVQCLTVCLGLFLVPSTVLVLDIIMAVIIRKYEPPTQVNCHRRALLLNYLIIIPSDVLTLVFSFAFGVASSIGVAAFMDVFNKMSWYSSTTFAILLYGLPAILGSLIPYLLIHSLISTCCIKICSIQFFKSVSPIPDIEDEEAVTRSMLTKKYRDSFSKYKFMVLTMIWSVVLAGITVIMVRSFYVLIITGVLTCVTVWVFMLFDLIVDVHLLRKEIKKRQTYDILYQHHDMDDDEVDISEYQRNPQFEEFSPFAETEGSASVKAGKHKKKRTPVQKVRSVLYAIFVRNRLYWLVCPFLITIIPSLMGIELMNRLLGILVPIIGRFATLARPDYVVAGLVGAIVSMLFFNFLPFIQQITLRTGTSWIIKLCLIVLLVPAVITVVAIAVFRNPYSTKAPKRLDTVSARTTQFGFDLAPTTEAVVAAPIDVKSRVFLRRFDAISSDKVISAYKQENPLNVTSNPKEDSFRGLFVRLYRGYNDYEYELQSDVEPTTVPSLEAGDVPTLSYQVSQQDQLYTLQLNINWNSSAFSSEIQLLSWSNTTSISFDQDQEKDLISSTSPLGNMFTKTGYYSTQWSITLSNISKEEYKSKNNKITVAARRLFCENKYQPPMLHKLFESQPEITLTGNGRCFYVQNVAIVDIQIPLQ